MVPLFYRIFSVNSLNKFSTGKSLRGSPPPSAGGPALTPLIDSPHASLKGRNNLAGCRQRVFTTCSFSSTACGRIRPSRASPSLARARPSAPHCSGLYSAPYSSHSIPLILCRFSACANRGAHPFAHSRKWTSSATDCWSITEVRRTLFYRNWFKATAAMPLMFGTLWCLRRIIRPSGTSWPIGLARPHLCGPIGIVLNRGFL